MPALFPIAFREFVKGCTPFFSGGIERAILTSAVLISSPPGRLCAIGFATARRVTRSFGPSWLNQAKDGRLDGETRSSHISSNRCVYSFFTGGISVFDSFAFCLYFLGHAIQPTAFSKIGKLKRITVKNAAKAFSDAVVSEPSLRNVVDARTLCLPPTRCATRFLISSISINLLSSDS